jgi:hypothetical protein
MNVLKRETPSSNALGVAGNERGPGKADVGGAVEEDDRRIDILA